MSSRRRGAPVLLVVSLLTATLAAGCGGGSDLAASNDAQRAAPPTTSVAAHFSLFKRARTGADEIPVELLPRSVATKLGLDLDTSRLARHYKGQPVFVVTSRELTCTFSNRNEVGNCWPTWTAERGLASAASICGLGGGPDKVVIFGLLPDGVDTVTVLRPGGQDVGVPVVGNVFIATVGSKPPLPQHFAFVAGGKQMVHPTGIPPDVARHGCGGGLPVPQRAG